VKRLKEESKAILKKILVHDEDLGGSFVSVTGSPGSSKTSVMLTMMRYLTKYQPKDKIFMSETYRAPLQCFNECNGEGLPIKLWVQEGSGVIFRDRNKRLKKINLPHETFKDFKDLYYRAPRGVVNVVFFGDREQWRDFMGYLTGVGEWVDVFVEEFQEICPLLSSLSKKLKPFIDTAKDFRKCRMNVVFNTQSIVEIAWPLVRKIQINIYLPGAQPLKWSRIQQKAIDNLEKSPSKGNESYIEHLGNFGKTRWEKIWKPNKEKSYEAFAER